MTVIRPQAIVQELVDPIAAAQLERFASWCSPADPAKAESFREAVRAFLIHESARSGRKPYWFKTASRKLAKIAGFLIERDRCSFAETGEHDFASWLQMRREQTIPLAVAFEVRLLQWLRDATIAGAVPDGLRFHPLDGENPWRALGARSDPVQIATPMLALEDAQTIFDVAMTWVDDRGPALLGAWEKSLREGLSASDLENLPVDDMRRTSSRTLYRACVRLQAACQVVVWLTTAMRYAELCRIPAGKPQLVRAHGGIWINSLLTKAKGPPLNTWWSGSEYTERALRIASALTSNVRAQTGSPYVFVAIAQVDNAASDLGEATAPRKRAARFVQEETGLSVCPHMFRRRFAGTVSTQDQGVMKAAALLKQSDLPTTQRYCFDPHAASLLEVP